MNSTVIPSLIVFGILLAIALIGLIRSNAAAMRLNGSDMRSERTSSAYENESQFANIIRR